MNKSTANFLTGKGLSVQRIVGWMMLFLLWAMPSSMNATHVDDIWNYSIIYNPPDVITMKLALYDCDGADCWVKDGYVYVEAEGESSKKTVLHYKAETDINNDHTYNKAKFSTGVNGSVQIVRNIQYGNEVVTQTERTINIYRPSKKQSYFDVEVKWTIPNEYRGKKLKFSYSINRNGNYRSDEKVQGLEPIEFSISQMDALVVPEWLTPMLAYEKANMGNIMVPWMMATGNIHKVTFHYTDNDKNSHTVALDTTSSGFVYMPCDKPLRDCYLEVNYSDTEKKSRTSKSDAIDFPILHTAKNLKAALMPDGTAILTWEIDFPSYKDVMDADMWEIQRCIGNDASDNKWQSIGQITYDNDSTSFTFTDATLFAAYQSDSVVYRVRRASTAVWGWSHAAGMARTSFTNRYYLPYVGLATVTKDPTWGVNDQHQVNIQWEMRNSPLKSYDLDGRFILRSAEDWETFAALVENGKTDLNAVMYSDINLGSRQTMVGTTTHPYRGVFDGNGHTLTFNYKFDINENVYDQDFNNHSVAPFAFVDDGVSIKYLHTAGSIATNSKFAGGIIGMIVRVNESQKVEITSCRSSVTINSTIKGDGTHGGLIGVSRNDRSAVDIVIANSLFDGKLIGKETDSWGGFVGWTYWGARVNIRNCFFNPQAVDINQNGSYTLFRSSYNGSNNIVNTYASTFLNRQQGINAESTNLQTLANNLGEEWTVSANGVVPLVEVKDYDRQDTYTAEGRFIIHNANDWQTFCNLVNSGQTKLNAVMADNVDLGDVQSKVGICNIWRDEAVYQGDFNGNGYTLTVNYVDTDNKSTACAPFAEIGGDCRIHDLHVKGSISSAAERTASLVANIKNGNVRLENIVSDVSVSYHSSIQAYNNVFGGFIGEVRNDIQLVSIKDCVFYGSLQCDGDRVPDIGGMIGWQNGYCTVSLSNVLFAPQLIQSNIPHQSPHAFITGHSGAVCTLSNCLSTYTGWPLQEGATDASQMTASAIAGKMGSAWTVEEGRAVPANAVKNSGEDATGDIAVWDERAKMTVHTNMIAASGEVVHTSQRDVKPDEVKAGKLTMPLANTCVDYEFYLTVNRESSPLYIGLKSREDSYSTAIVKTETGDDANYEFNLNGEVTALNATQQQASVQLNWITNNLAVDYYRVLRRDKTDTTGKVDTLVTNYTQKQFIDLTPQPQHVYTYRVEAIVDCEGQHLTYAECDGYCAKTGMVQGYVRLADGTAVAGATVVAEPSAASHISGAVTRSTVTDESGFFQIDSLIYQSAGSYVITVTRKGNEGQVGSHTVNFTEYSNLTSDLMFYVESYYTYSGVVMYEGSSIPVLGAQFKLDGQLITKSTGKDKGKPVSTNSAGEFSLSIPKGTHTVQVVKDGHVFADNGFLINHNAPAGTDSTMYNFQDNVYEAYLWDQTRVTLRGRVVGGKDQGSLPLGQSLSTNNLGDSIRIVMQLEGDNTSFIVRDQKDETIRMRDSIYAHGVDDTTRVVSNRHTITISPDNKTGEFQVPFYPVKYKVTDIYCNGYATLFQAGKVGETLDLTDNVLGDTVTYNRIYHKPATLNYEQFTGSQDSYFGLKEYKAQDNIGNNVTVNLWKNGKYTLGYPVFMGGSPVLLTLSAREEYFYNNVEKDAPDDIVLLSGGTVYLHNGLIDAEHTDSVQLDEEGKATYLFTPRNTTFINDGDNALKSLTFTLLYDDTYYDINPLKAYVMDVREKSQGKRLLVSGTPHLVDILRDPPGSESCAFIEEGSKLKYGYNYNFTLELGFNIELKQGSGSDYYTGAWAGEGSGTAAGETNSTESTSLFDIGIVMGYHGGWNYSYELETTKKIETSSNVKSVGASADVYIGTTEETVIEDAIAVRVVPESMYKLLMPAMGNSFNLGGKTYEVKLGTVKLLAEGEDADGNKVYLIRDEVLKASPRIKSSFSYSQEFIESELIPQLLRVRESMMLPVGTSKEEAQAQAKRLKRPVYVSKVSSDNPYYAMANDKGEYTYTQYLPEGTTMVWPDSIASLNNEIVAWIGFLATNEKEKLMVSESDKLESISFDGNSKVEYEEAFSYALEKENYMKIPLISSGSAFGDDFMGKLVKNLIKPDDGEVTKEINDEGKTTEVGFNAAGKKLSLHFKPIFSYDFNYMNTSAEEYAKKTGFSLNCDRQSYLIVDVYRSKVDLTDYQKKINDGDMSVVYKYSEEFKDKIRSGAVGTNQAITYMPYDAKTYSNFIFRTRGGATKKPYEDERLTQYYNRGAVLDAKTIAIDNLKIWTDQATVSNVPYGEPARFTIHLCNETEAPNLATRPFEFYREETDDNAKGARIMVDGMPLTQSGMNVWLEPNTVVDKQVEVYAGTEFDYDDLSIALWDPEDYYRTNIQNISAHFLPSAGKVSITSPGDKWVINTESPYNKDREQHYMPVRIEDFNVNARGFDHIELQYKLSTEGDKSWVNVCSYYKSDSLMQLASGERKLIKNDGYIDDAIFYGEKDPVEQYYDLRAVVYCRHAGGYITSSSPVLSGVKDTRIPVPFGTPKPVNGILDIGDDIVISFSEPIAGNYLSKVNNFEVMGTTNSDDISLSTAMRFTGKTIGMSQVERSLAGKSFTFDVMLNPDHNNKTMAILSHGNGLHKLVIGVAADGRLVAMMENQLAYSDKPVKFTGFHQVAYSFELKDDLTTDVTFYDGSEEIGRVNLKEPYQGSGFMYFGNDIFQAYNYEEALDFEPYEGGMMEYRFWNTAMSSKQLKAYSQKLLTGYELNLIDNYPFNEGTGEYTYNKSVGGGDLNVFGSSWIVPQGISLKLDGEKGVKLNGDYFDREEFEDYTLMFWFNTPDRDGTLMSNGLGKDEPNNGMHFFIGLEDGQLVYRSSGVEVKSNAYVTSSNWHHYAMTICRSRNVGNIYLDNKLIETFAVDSLGGIAGDGLLAVGATYTDEKTATLPLSGNIDEIAMYEMVLPENLIKTYSSSTPTGQEMGTMVYLPFSRVEKYGDNQTDLQPIGISIKKYKDNQGNISETRQDTIIDSNVMYALADRANYARMNDRGKMGNLAYSYVVDGQELLLNLDVPDASIEKTNVYITVKDVADLNGNLTASPVVMDLYVYRNPLRWDLKRLDMSLVYGKGDTYGVKIKNLSGKRESYTLSGLPFWITPSKTAGTIDALEEEIIYLTISPYINIGNYNEKMYLVGSNGMTEPLPISVVVRGKEPEWVVSDALKSKNVTMHVVGRVSINNNVMHDPDDMVAVFGDNHEVLGVAHIDVDQTASANEALVFLTIYNHADTPTELQFEYYDASTGKIHVVFPDFEKYPDDLTFSANTVLGTTVDPLVLSDYLFMVQTIPLKKGWNWVSFNVRPQDTTVDELLSNTAQWEVGDGIEVINSDGEPFQFTYKAKKDPDDPNKKIYFWDHGNDSVKIDNTLMYRVYCNSPKTAYMAGLDWNTTLTVKHGWNRIAYLSTINLPLTTALAQYTEYGSEGDMIKSQDEFAVLNVINDAKVWKGSLKFLRASEGYMLKRTASDEVNFSYPVYGSNSRYAGDQTLAPQRNPLYEVSMANNMNVIAITEGVELEEGDHLVAYHGAEVCGVAEADEDGIFYLTVEESANSASNDIQFSIERDGEVVALTGQTMRYVSDAVVGSVPEPTVINFVPADQFADGEWYTIQGLRLQSRPTTKGVYIYQGKKVFIK